MRNNAYILVFTSTALLLILTVTAFNFYVDPFTYYHRPWTDINYSSNGRYSNPGLARNFEYRTALIGTSLVMEVESGRLSEIMGQPSLNLSISGSLIKEQSLMADLVLRQGQAEDIIWEMTYPSFSIGDATSEDFPEYLYAPSVETFFRYLMSFDTFEISRDALRNPGTITIDNRYQQTGKDYSRERVMQAWNAEKENWNAALREYWSDYQKTAEPPAVLIERRLKPIVEKYPDVSFRLLLPPNSILDFLVWADRGGDDFERWMAFRDSLAMLAGQFPNVMLYDFQSDLDTITNLDLYRDLAHYSPDLLDQMFVQLSKPGSGVGEAVMRDNTARLRVEVKAWGKSFCGAEPDRCTESLGAWLGISR